MEYILIAVALVAANFFAWRLIGKSIESKDIALSRMHHDLQRVQAYIDNLQTERQLHHDTMVETFDYLNDSSPFGSHNEGLMQLRNKLMLAIQTSTVGK